MGSRGPLPKPTALRLLEGNPSGKPLNDAEPRPVALVTLEPPNDLGSIGRDVWAHNAGELSRLGLLTHIDREAFYRYCWTAERWHLARQKVETMGQVIPRMSPDGKTLLGLIQNPYWYIERSYAQELSRYEQAFGMTPSARTRFRIEGGTGGGGAIPDTDPFS